MFFVVKRATLLITSGPPTDLDRKHLFVCLTDAVGNVSETLIVSVSSVKPRLPIDESCRLFPGDHPFIKHDSFIDYRNARISKADTLMNGVKVGVMVAMEPLETAVFARVCYGLEKSPFTAAKHLLFYRDATGH